MNIDEAVARACREPSLTEALTWIAIWETDRAVKQALEWERTGVSTASHGGGWDTNFGYLFEHVMEHFERPELHPGFGPTPSDAGERGI